MICNNCQKQIVENSKFCKYCGAKINSNVNSISNQSIEKKSPFLSVVYMLTFILAFGVVSYLVRGGISILKTGSFSGDSTAELIKQEIPNLKAQMALPYKVDDVTTLVDITGESNAIRYHYVLSGVDTTNLSNEAIRTKLGSGICQNKDTRKLLDSGINMEYSYSVKNSTENYYVSFSKADCI